MRKAGPPEFVGRRRAKVLNDDGGLRESSASNHGRGFGCRLDGLRKPETGTTLARVGRASPLQAGPALVVAAGRARGADDDHASALAAAGARHFGGGGGGVDKNW